MGHEPPDRLETYARCAEDFDRACDCFVAAGKVRRDATPGSEGHLESSDMPYPNGEWPPRRSRPVACSMPPAL